MPEIWNAEEYARHGRFVADLAGEVFGLLNPQPGERILDLGCGDGALSERMQRAGANVIGVDSSAAMVSAARERGIDAHQLSAEQLPFNHEFDAVFSNAALHWMEDQDAVLRGVHRALKPDGRFVAELGAHGNIAAIRAALRAVFAPFGIDAEQVSGNTFFTEAEYAARLAQNGFAVSYIALVPRPTLLPTGIKGWVQTFRRSLLATLPPARRDEVTSDVEDLLKPILCDRSGQWFADYVRLRFVAVPTAI